MTDFDAVLEERIREIVEEVSATAPEVVSAERMRDLLGVSVRRMKTLRAAGLPALKIGSMLFFDMPEVFAWLRERGRSA